jgi:hypothetical protein
LLSDKAAMLGTTAIKEKPCISQTHHIIYSVYKSYICLFAIFQGQKKRSYFMLIGQNKKLILDTNEAMINIELFSQNLLFTLHLL